MWSPTQSRVDAVEYIDGRRGLRMTQACRAVVAAGTGDTTMILLNSVSSDFLTASVTATECSAVTCTIFPVSGGRPSCADR